MKYDLPQPEFRLSSSSCGFHLSIYALRDPPADNAVGSAEHLHAHYNRRSRSTEFSMETTMLIDLLPFYRTMAWPESTFLRFVTVEAYLTACQ